MKIPAFFRNLTARGALGFGLALATGTFLASATPQWGTAAHASGSAVAAPAPAMAPGPAPTSYADVVDRAAPAVVTIRVEKRVTSSPALAGSDDDFLQRFFGGGGGGGGQVRPNRRGFQAPVERGLGSGVIVSADGNILTNNHVVDGADTVKVTLADGREFSAKVVGTDPKTDLAVVHIAANGLTALPLGDSDTARVGDVVLAVGNPLGIGETVTMGIISAKGRTTDSGDGAYEDFLQTDAPINQGNSGGALMTATGQFVGINSQIVSTSGGNIGIGFAIPTNMAKHVMTELLANGTVRRAMIGVTIQSLTSDQATSLHLDSMHGALVGSVTPGGPADKAGVRKDDVILKVDGVAIDNSNDLRNRVSAMTPGATVRLDIRRNGATQKIAVNLGELTDTPAAPPRPRR